MNDKSEVLGKISHKGEKRFTQNGRFIKTQDDSWVNLDYIINICIILCTKGGVFIQAVRPSGVYYDIANFIDIESAEIALEELMESVK